MKTLFLLGLFLASFLFASAQQDAKAKQILDEVSKKTRSFNTISADFVFSMKNDEMDIYEKNTGSIQLKGQKYVVDLPELGVKVYSDGETLWNYMADGNQVTISYLEDGGSELMDPSSVFTIYERGFRSKYIGEKNLTGNEVSHEIELFPDTDKHEVTRIVLFIGKADNTIKSAQLFGTDGNIYGIEVKKMNTSANLPDTYFIFNSSDFSDLEIIDFR